MDFILDEEHPITTVAKLKKKFYRDMVLRKEELNPPFRKDPKGKHQWKPICIRLNPECMVAEGSGISTDFYMVVYYRGYFVKVTHGLRLSGPHKFELYYQVHKGVNAWLGTCTHKFVFFDKKRLKKKLRKNIKLKLYFCTDKSAEEIIQLIPENSTSATI